MQLLPLLTSLIASLAHFKQDDVSNKTEVSGADSSDAHRSDTVAVAGNLPRYEAPYVRSYHASPLNSSYTQYTQHSWHIPKVMVYRYLIRPKTIPVLFLQNTTTSIEHEIKSKISNYDQEWMSEHSETQRDAILDYYLYIRDGRFLPNQILTFIERFHDHAGEESIASILIDPEAKEDECMVVLTHRGDYLIDGVETRVLNVSAAKVPFRIAHPLASLVMNQNLSYTLPDLLGSEFVELEQELTGYGYPEEPDFPSSHTTIQPKPRNPLSLAPKTQPSLVTIFAMRPLSEEQVDSLKQRVRRGVFEVVYAGGGQIYRPGLNGDITVDVIIRECITPPTRGDMYLIFDNMEKACQSTLSRTGLAFFVDYIDQDEDGQLQVLAASRVMGQDQGNRQISLFPIQAESIPSIYFYAMLQDQIKAGINPDVIQNIGHLARDSLEQRILDLIRGVGNKQILVERISDPRTYIPNMNLNPDRPAPTVWFLRDFTVVEQRRIRELLLADADCNKDVVEFEFISQVFEHGNNHTIDDLWEVFQAGDQNSPFFNASHTSWRFDGYPERFIAVDDRIFDQQESRVHFGALNDFQHPTSLLGVHLGTVASGCAYSAWLELERHDGLLLWVDMYDSRDLWLNDLTGFRAAVPPYNMWDAYAGIDREPGENFGLYAHQFVYAYQMKHAEMQSEEAGVNNLSVTELNAKQHT